MLELYKWSTDRLDGFNEQLPLIVSWNNTATDALFYIYTILSMNMMESGGETGRPRNEE